MERVLLIMNAKRPSLAAIDFACKVAQPDHAMLTGLFVEESIETSVHEEDGEATSYFNNVTVAAAEARVLMNKAQAIQLFKEVCQQKGIVSQAYVEKGDLIQDILYESRFTDLIVLDHSIPLTDNEEPFPSHFMDQILAKTECPVVLASDRVDEVDKVVFCYEGSASSVFAMKQFTHLLPQFSEKPAVLLEVNSSGVEHLDESSRRLLDWLSTHYAVAHYKVLSAEELYKYFFKPSQKLVVMGAHLRRKLSKAFCESYISSNFLAAEIPFFITHY